MSCLALHLLLQLFTPVLSVHFLVEPPPLIHTREQLKCQTQPNSIITWQIFKDNNWTVVNQEFSQLKVDKKVDLSHFTNFDNFGEFPHFYRCLAQIASKTILSHKVLALAINEIPVFSQLSSEGASTALHCKIPHLLEPFLKVDHWIKDGQPIKRGQKFRTIEDFLYISSIDKRDQNSDFRCRVRNHVTRELITSQTGRVLVSTSGSPSAPRITGHSIRWAEEGEDIFLLCSVRGIPFPEVFWIKNEKIVGNGELLHLRSVSMETEGVFRCFANNSFGSDSFQTFLRIKTESISVSLEIQETGSGKLLLNCSTTGSPINSLVFYKNGQKLISESKRPLLVVDKESACFECHINDDINDVSFPVISRKCRTEEKPRLVSTFARHVIDPGERVSLRCVASGHPIPTITWSVDGQPIGDSHRIQLGDFVSSNGDLINSFVNISHARVEDSGLYQCFASNSGGQELHRQALVVRGALFMRAMANKTAVDGTTLVVRCPVVQSEVNEPKIVWFKGEKEVSLLSERHVTHENGSLLIRDLNRDLDSGLYTCLARTSTGESARRDFFLRVLKKPVLSSFAFPLALISGQRVIITCSILEGDHPIRMVWLKGEKPVERGPEVEEISMPEMGSSLVFRRVLRQHSGLYTCLAENAAGNTTQSAEMVVREPPKWTQEPIDRSVTVGESARFDCRADGFPVPVIRWKVKIGEQKEFRPLSSNYKIQSLENGSLVLRETQKSDEGLYVCEAGNGVGSDISRVVRLTVNVGAHFKKSFQILKLKSGQKLRVICEAFGEKPLSLKWRRGRGEVGDRYSVTERQTEEGIISELMTDSAQRSDSSIFSCFAFNLWGKSEMTVQVVVEEEPDPVLDLRVAELGPKSASIQWSEPFSGNNAINKYIIEWKKGTEDTWSRVETRESHVTVNDLLPMTSYLVRVRAENAIGVSQEVLVSMTTEEEIPEVAVKDIRVEPLSSRSLKVEWRPLGAESRVRGYYIGYREVERIETQMTFKSIEFMSRELTSKMDFVLNDLQKNTKYLVTVQAFNNRGAGPQSQEVMGTTYAFDPPLAPHIRLETTDDVTRVNITWSQTNENPIQGFRLFWRKIPENWIQISERLDSGIRWHLVSGLQCGQHFQFYLKSFNGRGDSPASDMLSRDLTRLSVGESPPASHVIVANQTEVELHLSSWRSGSAFCPINWFRVRYRPLSDRKWETVSERVSSETTSLTINGLQAGHYYALLISGHFSETIFAEKEFLFATLTPSGGTVPPMTALRESRKSKLIVVFIPIGCALAVLLVIGSVLLFICLKRSHERTASLKREDLSMTHIACKKSESQSEGFPIPYASSQLFSEDNEYDLPQKMISRAESHSHHCCRH